MSIAQAIQNFFKHEAAGGILLMIAAALALIVANSPLSVQYFHLLEAKVAVTFNGFGVDKDLLHWINDGLMAIFFFLIGLELKRELMEGKLKNPRDVILPGMAAVGGMVVPALIYVFFNLNSPETLNGWAIPAATDIAFALGVLALVGDRAPVSLKIFLLTLAILDDVGAILIIALFYTADLNLQMLGLATIPLAFLILRNVMGAHRIAPSILLGIVIWVLVLKSGVHATLAGVVTAFCIPLKDKWGKSPLHSIEHNLPPYVYFFIVPVFAFANAGVVLTGLSPADLLSPVPLGIALGLIIGKQIGVFGMTWLIVKLKFASIPHGANWLQIYGVSCLAGIGFTMSLFIGGLSFPISPELMNGVRLGVLSGSFISAILGYTALVLAAKKPEGSLAEVVK